MASVFVPVCFSRIKSIKFAGVNLARFNSEMQTWEIFTPRRYVPEAMVAALTEINRHLNVVRLMVGSKHLVEVSGYASNLIHTLQTAKDLGLWVVIGVWPSEIATTGVDYRHYDPYFDLAGFELQKRSMRTLAQLVSKGDFAGNVLYIDLRNEINGHLGSAYDDEWYAAQDLYGYTWGYVPDRAAGSFQGWLKSAYGTLLNLNAAWGGSYSRWDQIPVFHANAQVDENHTQPGVTKDDHRAWLWWCLRDWVTALRGEIKAVDSSIRVGQSTTTDQEHDPVADWQLNTSGLFRQLDVGDLVDVLDYHTYGAGHVATIQMLKGMWPDKPFVAGESWNEADEISSVRKAGDGLLFWSAGCLLDYGGRYHCLMFIDSWKLTEEGEKFLNDLNPVALVRPGL